MAIRLAFGGGCRHGVDAYFVDVEDGIALHCCAVALNSPRRFGWIDIAVLVKGLQRKFHCLSCHGVGGSRDDSSRRENRHFVYPNLCGGSKRAIGSSQRCRAFLCRSRHIAVGIDSAAAGCGPCHCAVVGSAILVKHRCHGFCSRGGSNGCRAVDCHTCCHRGIAVDGHLPRRSLKLRHCRAVAVESHGALRLVGVVSHIGIYPVGVAESRCRRDVGGAGEIAVAITAVAMDDEVGNAVGVGFARHSHISIPHLIHYLCRLVGIVALQVRQDYVAEPLLLTECRLGGSRGCPATDFLRRPHLFVVPLGKVEVLTQIVETRRDGHPLDGVHPHGVAREPCPPAYASGGEVTAIGMLIERAVDVFLVAVKPVFRHAFRLRYPAEDASIAHLLVAESHAEQIHSAPALHGFRGRLLTVAVARVAEAACIGMSRPRAEGA